MTEAESQPAPKRKRGRPPKNDPIRITSLRYQRPDPELLASALLMHYQKTEGSAEMQQSSEEPPQTDEGLAGTEE